VSHHYTYTVLRLDSLGIAGFSFDFGTLYGKQCDGADGFNKFYKAKPSFTFKMTFLLGLVFPSLMKLPTGWMQLATELNNALGLVGKTLLERTRQEGSGVRLGTEETSIIGLLLKAESSMSENEVLSQLKLLLLAGYGTTAGSLSWALAELAQNQSVQIKLQEELSRFVGRDPSYEQLINGLPYLDAVVLETLRIRVAIPETTRIATEDDLIPLSEPIRDASGTLRDPIVVSRGTRVTVSIPYMNRSEKLWGTDAKKFKPERWLNPGGLECRAREIQGHKHLLTFADGPRMYLGKAFALTESKAVLSTLVRNFAFEMRDNNAQLEVAPGLAPRPRIVGEEGVDLPLRIIRL